MIAACTNQASNAQDVSASPDGSRHRARQHHSVSGVRVGEDLSSFRNSCSANCQNSASRSSGRPACSQSLYARASISCFVGSGIMIAPGWCTVPLSGGFRLIGGTVPDQLGDWPADSSPHEAASSKTSPQDTGHAGVTPHPASRTVSQAKPRQTGPGTPQGFTSCCATRTFPSCIYSIAGEALSVRILRTFQSKER